MIVQPQTLPDAAGNSKIKGKRWSKQPGLQTFRRLIQAGMAAFIIFLAAQHIIIGENGPAVIASPEAFCPFGGLETVYEFLTDGGIFISHTHLSNLIMLVAVLATALLFRSAFCGWLCPLGAVQDLMHGAGKAIQKAFPGLRRGLNSISKSATWLAVVDRYLRFGKYILLAWAVGGSAYFGYMVFRDYDPWSAFLSLAEFSLTPGFIVLVVTLIASLFVKRPWCRYACPLGAVSGVVGMLSPTYLKRVESACTSCKLCTRACPMGLEVHKADTIKAADCNTCLVCLDSCPQKGALEIKFGLPVIGK